METIIDSNSAADLIRAGVNRTITNQAFLTFEYGMNKGYAQSNVAVATLRDPINISKLSLNTSYTFGETIFFILSVTNSGNNDIKNLILNDNLGTYMLGDISVTPMTFVTPAQLYIDGIFDSEIIPEELQNGINFTISNISAGSNAMILYKTTVNNMASLEVGSTITNIVSCAAGIRDTVSTENTILVSETADIEVVKNMAPSVLHSGDEIFYSFDLYNYGNTDAVNVIMTDTFSPAPANIKVTVDGVVLSESDFTYINDTLTIPSSNTIFPMKIPKAVFSQDKITGVVMRTPGVTRITASGNLL